MYIHRSGRTARGLNTSGKTLSIVSPADASAHETILEHLHMTSDKKPTNMDANNTISTSGASGGNANTMKKLSVDYQLIHGLKQRITVAKKVSSLCTKPCVVM